MRDARYYFDCYLVENSTLAEIIEVLQYTFVFGERCIGRVIKEMIWNKTKWVNM